ncbi:peptide ABC transporter permease [Clostridia bacterium]|nr:peptide ABC transporter permease [Clostridia bacterium]
MKKKPDNTSHSSEIVKAFRKNKAAMIGLCLLALLVLTAIFADVIVPYQNGILQNARERLQGPSKAHLFGTDEFGRDVFTRIVHGSRYSIAIGIGSTVIALAIGTVIGAICGLYGGLLDQIVMRLCDVVTCIPFMLLALAVVSALGASMINLLVAMTIASCPGFIRMIRSVILTIAEQDYILAAKGCGVRRLAVIFRHVIPNAAGPIIVQGSMSVASMILAAAGLSYIGMGINPPTPEWGSMLNASTQYINKAPYLMFFAGVAIALAALSMNLVGDGIRDAFDPRLKS